MEKSQYLRNHLTDFDEIWHCDAPETSTTRRPLILTEFEYSKSKMAASRHL